MQTQPLTDLTYYPGCSLATTAKENNISLIYLFRHLGYNLIELEDTDLCCGGAGSFSFTHHELSRKVGAAKTAQIRKTGAKYVATPCPSCKMQLDDMLRHEGLDIKTVHPVEILDKSYMMKEKTESVFFYNDVKTG